MKTETVNASAEMSKKAYAAPSLVSFGDAKEITRSVNVLGPGDVQFSLLLEPS